jgi:hypothetical protein
MCSQYRHIFWPVPAHLKASIGTSLKWLDEVAGLLPYNFLLCKAPYLKRASAGGYFSQHAWLCGLGGQYQHIFLRFVVRK